jgi:2-polyprenyl-3-methyl-5-hydroxy-6-metoxy-1,4-benzoquinol methylase
MKTINGPCILCGSSQRSLIYTKDEWKVYKCDNCGLGILNPLPDGDELTALYQKDYFLSHYDNELVLDSPEMEKRLSQQKHRLRFFRKFKKKGKVLDVGCGCGYFLLACRKKGYDVAGIDISPDAAAYVNKELNIPVYTGEFSNIELPDKTYDVITMWHSLEHIDDPFLCIQNARKWLKDKGILVIDVPNHDGYDARKLSQKWSQWDLPFHFHHFTPRSLALLLEKHSFTIIRKKSYLSEYVKDKLQKAALPSTLARIIARFYSGGSYAVVAKKKL